VARRGWPPAAVLLVVGAVAYGIDRLTKALAEDHLAGRPPIEVIPRVVQLRFATNSGGAFSLFPGHPWVFFFATIVICAVILVTAWRLRSRLSGVALGLVLGGALGNLTDRIVRGPGVSGRVVDFIDFHIWPVFNTADSCIVIGALLLAFAGVHREAGTDHAEPTTRAEPATPETGSGPEPNRR
jgi:signal peptidase II